MELLSFHNLLISALFYCITLMPHSSYLSYNIYYLTDNAYQPQVMHLDRELLLCLLMMILLNIYSIRNHLLMHNTLQKNHKIMLLLCYIHLSNTIIHGILSQTLDLLFISNSILSTILLLKMLS